MKRWLLAGFAIGGAVFAGFSGSRRRRVSGSAHKLALASRRDISERAVHRYLLYFMLPFWIVPGLLDWWWHKKTRIESTAGTRESVIHSLMMAEAGFTVVPGLFLEVNAGVILLMLSAAILHWLTTAWDVAYAVRRRDVRPNEQHIHSFLEVLPFCAVSFVACLYWKQAGALLGLSRERPRWRMQLKQPPASFTYMAGLALAITLGVAVPYAEEFWRCRKAEGLVGRDTPGWVRERAAEKTMIDELAG